VRASANARNRAVEEEDGKECIMVAPLVWPSEAPVKRPRGVIASEQGARGSLVHGRTATAWKRALRRELIVRACGRRDSFPPLNVSMQHALGSGGARDVAESAVLARKSAEKLADLAERARAPRPAAGVRGTSHSLRAVHVLVRFTNLSIRFTNRSVRTTNLSLRILLAWIRLRNAAVGARLGLVRFSLAGDVVASSWFDFTFEWSVSASSAFVTPNRVRKNPVVRVRETKPGELNLLAGDS